MMESIKKSKCQPYVFLSYSSKDSSLAKKIVTLLKGRDVPIWFDNVDLKIGESLSNEIKQAITNASFFCVLLSRNSLNSEWVKKELQWAQIKQSLTKFFILPILLEKVELPDFLKDIKYVDFSTVEGCISNIPELLNVLGVESTTSKQHPSEEKSLTANANTPNRLANTDIALIAAVLCAVAAVAILLLMTNK